MVKPKVFIASSEAHVTVAGAIADELEPFANVTVWNDGVFRLNDSFLQDLMAAPNLFDFAVMVWAPDDVTTSEGQSTASPRDNVIFESGLFMGVLGLDHVFVVQDQEGRTRIPSDFKGITLATYDGSRIAEEPRSAVRSACHAIQAEMSKTPFKNVVGGWRQRYMECAAVLARPREADIEVAAFRNTVSFVRRDDQSKEVVFEARGRVGGNRIRGEWSNESTRLNHGPFLLVLDTAGDVMFGYTGAYDPDGGAVFQPWILAKKTGHSDAEIDELLSWGQKTLKKQTAELPAAAVAAAMSA